MRCLKASSSLRMWSYLARVSVLMACSREWKGQLMQRHTLFLNQIHRRKQRDKKERARKPLAWHFGSLSFQGFLLDVDRVKWSGPRYVTLCSNSLFLKSAYRMNEQSYRLMPRICCSKIRCANQLFGCDCYLLQLSGGIDATPWKKAIAPFLSEKFLF